MSAPQKTTTTTTTTTTPSPTTTTTTTPPPPTTTTTTTPPPPTPTTTTTTVIMNPSTPNRLAGPLSTHINLLDSKVEKTADDDISRVVHEYRDRGLEWVMILTSQNNENLGVEVFKTLTKQGIPAWVRKFSGAHGTNFGRIVDGVATAKVVCVFADYDHNHDHDHRDDHGDDHDEFVMETIAQAKIAGVPVVPIMQGPDLDRDQPQAQDGKIYVNTFTDTVACVNVVKTCALDRGIETLARPLTMLTRRRERRKSFNDGATNNNSNSNNNDNNSNSTTNSTDNDTDNNNNSNNSTTNSNTINNNSDKQTTPQSMAHLFVNTLGFEQALAIKY